jgi:hypothetical protein
MKTKLAIFALLLLFLAPASRAAQTIYASVLVNQTVPTSTFTTYQTVNVTTTVDGIIQVSTEANGSNSGQFRIQVDGVLVGTSAATGGTFTVNINGQSAELSPGSHTITVQAKGTQSNSDVGGFSTIVTLPSEPDSEIAVQLQQIADLLADIQEAINAGNAATVAQLQTLQTLLNTQLAQIQERLDAVVSNTGHNNNNSDNTVKESTSSLDTEALAKLLASTKEENESFWEENAKYFIIGGGVLGAAVIFKFGNQPSTTSETRPGYYEN